MCVHLFTTHLPHHAGALYPLELIKTRMQVISDSTGTYRSLTKAFGQVLRNEGVKGLYQGMSPALVGASGSWGGYFYFYEQSKERKLRKLQSTGKGSSLLTADHVRRYLPCAFASNLLTMRTPATFLQLASGVEAGVILVLLFNPVWVVKTRLALQGAETGGQAKYKGSIGECFEHQARDSGELTLSYFPCRLSAYDMA